MKAKDIKLRDVTSLIANAASDLDGNVIYNNSNSGIVHYIEYVLNKLEIEVDVVSGDLNRIPVTGAFIMVCNRPFDGFESLAILKILNNVRSDVKIIGNFELHKIEALQQSFFNFDFSPAGNFDIKAFKVASRHLAAGKPLVVFPAGNETDRFAFDTQKIDKKWNNTAINFIKNSKVPVLPVCFTETGNIHLKGSLNLLLQKALLRVEDREKQHGIIKVRIASPIMVDEQHEFKDAARYGRYIRAKLYSLENPIEVKNFFKPLFKKTPKIEDIVDPVDPNIIQHEISKLPESCLLFSHTNYSIYCAPHSLIPSIVTEIGRLREVTFREVGEGTNTKIDIDEYDLYYRHLFIWDNTKRCIVGAYRIGMGDEIMQKYGAKGFYIRSLFKIKKDMHPILRESLEMGRSFIVKDYQRNPITLFLLWKGILYFLLQNEKYRYLTGPVSISNNFSNISKTLITEYIKKNHWDKDKAKMVKPRKKFKVNFAKIDTEIIHEHMNDMNALDKMVRDIEPENYRVPVLLKKYMQLNGKIVCFNIDPLFNDALDGLLVLDLYTIPNDNLKLLSKELDLEVVAKRMNKNKEEILDFKTTMFI